MARANAVSILIIGLLTANGWCQKLSSYDRGRAQDMLQEISSDIKKHYYDPKFHGVNWDAKVSEMKQKISASDSMPQAMSEVAAALDALNDSHTYFLPPRHAYRHDYGWQAQMIGDRCYVLRVRPGSDAESKGMKPGDEIAGINGYTPNRENFWKMQYVFNMLRPQPGLRLVLRSPVGEQRQLDVAATVKEEQREVFGQTFLWEEIERRKSAAYLGRSQFLQLSDEVGVLKFPQFLFAESEIDGMIATARKHKALILDLRGDPGGSVETLKYLIGGFFEKEVKIGDRVGRSEQQPMIAKPHGKPFTGPLVVLVDSKSGSAAELFARVVQIEKRGTVLGDRSSGSVMEAKHYTYKSGIGMVTFYGASITDADIIMTDGKSLEHNGVIPDEVMLPAAEDLTKGRDPVLARAAEIAGGKLSPAAAGKLFPYEWPKI